MPARLLHIETEGPRHAESGFKQVMGRLERLCGRSGKETAARNVGHLPLQLIVEKKNDNWILKQRGKSKWSDKTSKLWLTISRRQSNIEHARSGLCETQADVPKIKLTNEEIPEILAY